MGAKEDEAADFLEKLLADGTRFVDVDDENQDLINKFDSVLETNNVKLSAEMEREYQEYIKTTAKHGYPAVSRAEFLAVLNATAGTSNKK